MASHFARFAAILILAAAFPACRLVRPPVDSSTAESRRQNDKPIAATPWAQDPDLLRVRDAFDSAQRGYRTPTVPSSEATDTQNKKAGASSTAKEASTPAFSAGPYTCRWSQRFHTCTKSSAEMDNVDGGDPMPDSFLCVSQQDCMGPFLRHPPSEKHLIRPELDLLTSAAYSAGPR